jgi:hypothetical protein
MSYIILKLRLQASKDDDNKFTYLGIKIPFYVLRYLNLQMMSRYIIKEIQSSKNGLFYLF